MNLLRSLYLPLALAVIAIVGIVAMLLLTGRGDAVAFLLAMLPLAVGGGVAAYQRNARRQR
jgi:hypothetical protein